MGLKSHQMDVETPAGGRDRSEGLHRRRGGRSTRGSLAEPYTGGLCLFHQDVVLGRPMMSSSTMEVLGGSYVPNGTCGMFLRPKKAKRFAPGGQRCPKRA
jgi:hypothetical protein